MRLKQEWLVHLESISKPPVTDGEQMSSYCALATLQRSLPKASVQFLHDFGFFYEQNEHAGSVLRK